MSTDQHIRPSSTTRRLTRRGLTAALWSLLLVILSTAPAMVAPTAAGAASYVPINGSGSSWSANAINQWIIDVKQYGMRVSYSPSGSSIGRSDFLQSQVDFAGSDIPFQVAPTDGSAPEHPTPGSYAYMPIVAGGTSFMYHLTIGGHKVTNLRLSGDNLAKIFTGKLTRWNDPAIAADNPGLTMPAEKIVPVIRSDGSGSSAQFSLWMQAQQPAAWNAFCARTKKCGKGASSYWPQFNGAIAQSGDLGVAGYVKANYAEGSIGYVQYSYAKNSGFPVAKMLNKAGYYVEPTPYNVAVSLTKAKINTNPDPAVYLTQDLSGVYTDTDPRVYPMSSYSYFILPTKANATFGAAQGATLAAFAYYFECQGQQQAPDLGYSPLPINLVQASFQQILKMPGAVAQNVDISKCNNPTFNPKNPTDNHLADIAPKPQPCDKQGPTQCSTGTGGSKTNTPVKASAGGSGGNSSGGGSGTTGGSGTGGSAGGGSGTAGGGTAGGTTAGGTTAGGTTAGGGSGGAQQYDPNTDQFVGGGADGGTGADGTTVIASPYNLAAERGWGSSQTLMLIAGLALVALVLTPAVAARTLRRRK